MSGFLHQLNLAAPFFALVFIGYGLMRFSGWPKAMSENLSRFVFSVAMPVAGRIIDATPEDPNLSVRINIDDGTGACIYDFKAVFSNGNEATRGKINVCEIGEYTYTD